MGFGTRLPLPTRILITISQWMSRGWFWISVGIGVFLLIILCKVAGARIKSFMDRINLHIPLVKKVVLQLELARFARAFGLLIEHGVPLFQALEVACAVVNHAVIRGAFRDLQSGLKEGSSLAVCLKQNPLFDSFFINTIAVGEEGGKLGDALREIAHFYEEEIDRLLHMLSALLEPVLILGVGCVVGFIVMAILLPVFEISTLPR
jgi:type II secretory pathway component PulF